ncbi:MAG: TAXI family TRAP transporter solute-binding subunit [Polaromonas sp.]|nr:TAXI family TRAP transporter solute-binding subunit [Polaromonas sp.]
MRIARLYRRQWLWIQLPLVLAAALTATALWMKFYPLPPTELTITTASTSGSYYRHALRYAELFAAHGVTLHVMPSAGSQQNLDRLRTPAQTADLAFIQGGFGYLGSTFEGRDRSRVQTLANVNIEPLWLFARQREIDTLHQLQGLRVAIGPEGSGSRRLALRLLEQARISTRDLTLSSLTGTDAVQAMRQGAIDAVMMVAGPSSAMVTGMLAIPGIHLANLRRSTAIVERNPYLEPRLLAQGTLAGRMPPRDITLLTTSANLVAREDLHPALKRLALSVAMDAHADGGLFHRAGDFPSLRRIDFPTAPGARQTLQAGLPLHERLLPFWWAQVAERVVLIVLPVVLISLWLVLRISAWMRWVLRTRVNRWYGELKYIENDLNQTGVTGMDVSRFLQRLDGIEKAMAAFSAPPELIARCLTLHHHIDFVRQRLYRMRGR